MKKLAISILVLALLGLIAYAVARQLGGQRVPVEEHGPSPVVLDRPRTGEIGRSLSYSGTLTPQAQVTLTPKIAGRIQSIVVTEGQRVGLGDLVALMEDETARLQYEQADYAYRAALAQYERAQKGARSEERENAQALLEQSEQDVASAEESYGRLERLYREGTISRSRYEDAERELRASRTALENARRNVRMLEEGASTEELDAVRAQMQAMQSQAELAKLGVEYARLTAPIGGRVARVHTDAGNMAGLTTPIVTIVDDDPLVARIPLPEKHYAEIRERERGIGARLRPTSLPGVSLEGTLVAVSPTVDPSSRTFTVEIEVRNPDGRLQAGMYANVDLLLQTIPDALLVPVTALATRAGRTGVFVVRDGKTARFVETMLGLQDSTRAQVLEGLTVDDAVVVDGGAFLEDGSPVTTTGTP